MNGSFSDKVLKNRRAKVLKNIDKVKDDPLMHLFTDLIVDANERQEQAYIDAKARWRVRYNADKPKFRERVKEWRRAKYSSDPIFRKRVALINSNNYFNRKGGLDETK
jgi:hypothetical protein